MDDAPAGRVGDEGVFMSVNANDTTAERCTWWNVGNLDLPATLLATRLAVNDGGTLTISLHEGQTCSNPAVTAAHVGDNDWTGDLMEFPEITVQRICITLADTQAGNQQRLSAIFDFLHLVDGSTFVFTEQFGRAG